VNLRIRNLRANSGIVAPSLRTRPLPPSEVSGWEGSDPETWQVSTSRTLLRLHAGGFDSNVTVTEVGVTLTVVPAEIARSYAKHLAEQWPEAAVYREERQAEPDTLRLLVVAPTWDSELERAAYDLMWIPEAEEAGLVLEVEVCFENRCAPHLTGFTRVR